MKLDKKTVFIILLITGALIGLVTIQILLLIQDTAMRKQTFSQNVHGAMSSVVQKLESMEALEKIQDASMEGRVDSTRAKALIRELQKRQDESLPLQELIAIQDSVILMVLIDYQRVRLVAIDSSGTDAAIVLDEMKGPGKHSILIEWTFRKQYTTYRLERTPLGTKDGSRIQSMELRLDPELQVNRNRLVNKVLDQYRIAPRPILSRMDPARLDSVIRTTLNERGILLQYVYGIANSSDSLVLAVPEAFKEKIRNSEYRTRLFPHDLIASTNDLLLFFPKYRLAMLGRWFLYGCVTFILFLIIGASFFITLRSIAEQKKFFNLLTDFINNMTHEFKTPISTIKLTGELLVKSGVFGNKSRLKKYSAIIQDESERLQRQVEKILEIAALENQDFELLFENFDIHEIIRKAVKNFTPQIEEKEGRVELRLSAGISMVRGDKFHIENVFHNLLDNAVKYTRNEANILIGTVNTHGMISISVQDNGVGLTRDEQKRIFDKYYRVPTGNVHTVKGYGIGLYYVRLMANAHGGRIGVTSEHGKGSIFRLELPLYTESGQGIPGCEETQ